MKKIPGRDLSWGSRRMIRWLKDEENAAFVWDITMASVCICQICQCGRHRCSAQIATDTLNKVSSELNPASKTKAKFHVFVAQPRREPILPPEAILPLKGEEPPVITSTTRADFIPHAIMRKRESYKPKGLRKNSSVKMANTTTYAKEFQYRGRGVVPKRHTETRTASGTLPGTLPGTIERISTYRRTFTAKRRVKKHETRKPLPNHIQVSKHPLQEIAETSERFQKSSVVRHAPIKPIKEKVKTESQVHGESITQSDFLPHKNREPKKIYRQASALKMLPGKFGGVSTYKSEYKLHPVNFIQLVKRVYETNFESSDEPFQDQSTYKSDFKAHPASHRKEPPWNPSMRAYKCPSVAMVKSSIYNQDFQSFPETVPSPGKYPSPKGHITCGEGVMDGLTMNMKDFQPVLNVAKRLSCKPPLICEKNEGKMLEKSLTTHDYRWTNGERAKQAIHEDQLVAATCPMEHMTTAMADFQWLTVDCPAAYIKNIGEFSVPNFQFDKLIGGHVYFKKLKDGECAMDAK